MSEHDTSQLLELPSAFLALLIQHTASGPGGLASAAALSQTCKSLHGLSEAAVVTYSNIHVPGTIRSSAHQVWQWLAKRMGRIAGLRLQLCMEIEEYEGVDNDELLEWTQSLQALSGIPDVQLRVKWEGNMFYQNHLCLNRWLRQHGQTISHLTVQFEISDDRLNLRDFAEAAASCKSVDLSVLHDEEEATDLAELAPLAGSLERLICKCGPYDGFLSGFGALSSLRQLTCLHLCHEDLTREQPWDHLAHLTSLEELYVDVSASGDPSPLLALTRLSSLYVDSRDGGHDNPSSFSSLQPLSAFQQLQRLHLGHHACTATSLQGLAVLRHLHWLELKCITGRLQSLEGIGSGVTKLLLNQVSDIGSLAGIEACSNMKDLTLRNLDVSSLQPLESLSSMESLDTCNCCLKSLESLSGMPTTSLTSLDLSHCGSLIHLSGVEQLTALRRLYLGGCGVTSLQPLSQLGEGLQHLSVIECSSVQEVVLELPRVQPTADVMVYASHVREVVLAGGVSKPMCGDIIPRW
jgi:hypothetical protein